MVHLNAPDWSLESRVVCGDGPRHARDPPPTLQPGPMHLTIWEIGSSGQVWGFWVYQTVLLYFALVGMWYFKDQTSFCSWCYVYPARAYRPWLAVCSLDGFPP